MMKKLLAVLMTLIVGCGLFSGCMSVESGAVLNADGTGAYAMRSGMTEESLLMMAMLSGVETEEAALEMVAELKTQFEPVKINEEIYYTTTKTEEFTNLDELNELLSSGEQGLLFHSNDDGTLGLSYLPSEESASQMVGLDEATRKEMLESGETTEEEMLEFMRGIVMTFDFEFPGKVKQVSGPNTGIEISENALHINMMALLLPVFEGKEVEVGSCEFVIEGVNATVSAPVEKTVFSDVSEDAWYYDAVMLMSDMGVVNGVGDGLFMPEGTLTYAQFCQILAKQMGVEVGSENGYWAEKAVAACVELGLIDNRGSFISENYDVPITREAAIAGMYRAVESAEAVKDLTDADIPDFAEIDAKFQEDVLNAYRIGILSGVDDKGTFLPKKNLTRAEICQLFYNIY